MRVDEYTFLAPDNAVVVGIRTARNIIEETEDDDLEGEEGATEGEEGAAESSGTEEAPATDTAAEEKSATE